MSVELYEFPDGFSIYANPKARMETDFLYKEIFQDESYNVAAFPQDGFMIDAGANIGLFSLFMKQKYPSSRILAFEPAPDTCHTFKRNMKLHDISDVELYECGLGRTDLTATLTFYANLPSNSTLHPDQKQKVIDLFSPDHPALKQMNSQVEEIAVDVKRLSGFLDQVQDLKRIDLLKIDVEGAELEVLYGIDDRHWDLVQHVALEICDVAGLMEEAERFIKSKGFDIRIDEPDWAPKETKMFMLIAKRVRGEEE